MSGVNVSSKIRKEIYLRDKYICQYCGKDFKNDIPELDHIIPKKRGGNDSSNNLVTSCKKCNGYKQNKTPKEYLDYTMARLNHCKKVIKQMNKKGFK